MFLAPTLFVGQGDLAKTRSGLAFPLEAAHHWQLQGTEGLMTTYVAFDGDKDIWAYRFMRGWSANKRIDFELLDAHDLDNMTARARGEIYVKSKLRERMNRSTAVVVLVGESTKFLHKYVRW